MPVGTNTIIYSNQAKLVFCIYFSGPLASIIVRTFSIRVSTMVCGLIVSLAYIVSAFAESIEVLYISYGVINGKSHATYPFIVHTK